MKIFIVEDDLVIAESLANELSKWNYEVHVVDNFEKIMEDFRRVEPQLVLLDINLPTLNGFHWCQEMRKVSHVPIMFISSRTDNMSQTLYPTFFFVSIKSSTPIESNFFRNRVIFTASVLSSIKFSDSQHFSIKAVRLTYLFSF